MFMISSVLSDDINWDVWGVIIETNIQNLIYLSLNLNPDKTPNLEDNEKHKNLLIRADVLLNNVGKHPLLMPTVETQKKRGLTKHLNVINFVEYAKLLEWDIPPELSRLTAKNLESINQVFEKNLSDKERQTLLVIIAALAKEARVDISKISKSGEQIAAMTQQLGASVGATTIETHLKKIPEALQSRAK